MSNTSFTSEGLSSDQVADFFIAFANEHGDILTNLKLQKLVYYAQAWYLANSGNVLFDEDFEAWVHGPVLPQLYRKYKKDGLTGATPICKNVHLEDIRERMPDEIFRFLTKVAQIYMKYAAYELELMTHKESPWMDARGGVPVDQRSNSVIDKSSIYDYYRNKIS